MEARKSQGFVALGRPPLLNAKLKKQFYKLTKDNKLSSADLSAQLNISQRTLENYLRQGYLNKKGPSFETHSKRFSLFSTKKIKRIIKTQNARSVALIKP